MKIFTQHALCLAALWICLTAALPCSAQRKPQWASDKAVEQLNAQRTNDTYEFVYIEPFFTDKNFLYENRMTQLTEKLAARHGLNADEAKVDTVAHTITFGDKWFRYKVVDTQEVFDSDVRQDWDYTLYQLFAVSKMNTEPVYDEFTVNEPCGSKSLTQSLIPGLGQWNKNQKDKAVVIWATEAASIGGAIYFFARDRQYSDYGWTSKAKSYRQMGYLAVGVAAGMYIYNLIDAYLCKGAKTVTVKKNHVSTALAPFATPDGVGVSMALRF